MNRYVIINIITLIISILLIILSLISKKLKNIKIKNEKIKKFEDFLNYFFENNYIWLVLILLFLTSATTLYKIGSVPYGMHVDEAGMAYDALNLAHFFTDRYKNLLPVYLINFGGGQSAMYAYIAAFFIKIFGYSTAIIRLPAFLLRLCAFISLYFTFKDNKKTSIIILGLFTICPYFIISSRWGLDCNLLVEFWTIAFCFFYKAITTSKYRYYILAGIFYGFSLYNYALSYLMLPLMLFFTLLYLLLTHRTKIKYLITMGIPLAILALPLILMILVNNGIINQINGPFFTIPKLDDYRGSEISLANIKNNFYLLKSIFSFDENSELYYNSNPKFGTIYYGLIPVFLMGFIYAIVKVVIRIIDLIKKKTIEEDKKDENLLSIIFLIWFLVVLFIGFIIDSPNINKVNPLFIPIIYFIMLGIKFIIERINIAGLIITFVLLINFTFFIDYYFNEYNDGFYSLYLWGSGYIDAIDYAREIAKDEIEINNTWNNEPFIYVLLEYGISPEDYRTNEITVTYKDKRLTYNFDKDFRVDYDTIYIVGLNQDLINSILDHGFKSKEFGNGDATFTVLYYEE